LAGELSGLALVISDQLHKLVQPTGRDLFELGGHCYMQSNTLGAYEPTIGHVAYENMAKCKGAVLDRQDQVTRHQAIECRVDIVR
jgi:hypothetical protein